MDELDPAFAAIEQHRAVLILGAGASKGCKRAGASTSGLPDSSQLAVELARLGGFSYSSEALSEVATAFKQVHGDDRLGRVLETIFKECRPSEALQTLVSVPWRRIYTFNVDDSLERTNKTKASQRYNFFNGLADRKRDGEGPANCQVVHLNGCVLQPSAGFIFSAEDYTAKLLETPSWYAQAGDDYVEYVPFFVGTTINEPILKVQIERASRHVRVVGQAYLIVPDQLSAIQQANLKKGNIVHLRMTLEEFVERLGERFPGGLRVADALEAQIGISRDRLGTLTAKDVNAASQLQLTDERRLVLSRQRFEQTEPRGTERFARGFPPSWGLIASRAFINLRSVQEVESWLSQSVKKADERCHVLVGDAGSGKTTALMNAVAKLQSDIRAPKVFEFVENASGLRSACQVASYVYQGERIVILIDDLFLYAEEVAKILASNEFPTITFVCGARASEWRRMVSRYLQKYANVHRMGKLADADTESILAFIERFVAAPGFRKLTDEAKRKRIQSYSRQLLILFKELTGEKPFDEIIADEYARLDDPILRMLLLIVGLATLARVGVPRQMVRRMSADLRLGDLDANLQNLDGIISLKNDDRLIARHELYVNHIIFDVARRADVLTAIKSIVRFFSLSPMPVARNFDRKDHQLFRYCFNTQFLQQVLGKGSREAVEQIFEEFRVPFQQDGHYWLQFGLYYRMAGRNDEALVAFENSIRAYPGNVFAVHALAKQKLRNAKIRRSYDTVAERLTAEAVQTLLEMHAQRKLEVDVYPIETLALDHCDLLVHHGMIREAREKANQYFEIVSAFERETPTDYTRLKSRLLMLASTGKWRPLPN